VGSASVEDQRTDGIVRRRADGIGEALLPSPCVQAHAANLTLLPGGDLACVWFGGSQEGRSDISIYMSRLPAGAEAWSAPQRLSDDPDRSEQNPILFPTPDGDLWLLHTAQVAGNQNTAVDKRRVSSDGGRTFGSSEIMIATPGTFVRQPPVVLANGDWLLPCFMCITPPGVKWIGDRDFSVVKVSSDHGRSWRDVIVPDSAGLVHMNILPASDGGLLALFRSRFADSIYLSRSADGGATWSPPLATDLPNNNSSLQAVRLRDGRIALVFNNVRATAATARRASLYDEIDDPPASELVPQDEGAFALAPAPVPGRQAIWGTPRAPLTLAMSADDGASWRIVADLETGDGYCLTNNSAERLNRELSYPSVIEAADGGLHIAFTYHRQAIKYLKLPATLVAPRPHTGAGRE
jgi:predicted neuraminidase